MNLLATLTIGEPWYAQHTIPWMRRYAALCGADLVECRQRYACALASQWAAWAKIDILSMFAEQNRYRRLLIIDADCLILPRCPSLFDEGRGPVSVVADMGTPVVATRYVEWCRYYLGGVPEHQQYFNSGVMGFTLDAARRLLPRLAGPYPDERHFEQDLLNFRIQEMFAVEFLPTSFNWLAPQFQEAAREQNIVHFVGGYKVLIPGFCAQLVAPC